MEHRIIVLSPCRAVALLSSRCRPIASSSSHCRAIALSARASMVRWCGGELHCPIRNTYKWTIQFFLKLYLHHGSQKTVCQLTCLSVYEIVFFSFNGRICQQYFIKVNLQPDSYASATLMSQISCLCWPLVAISTVVQNPTHQKQCLY